MQERTTFNVPNGLPVFRVHVAQISFPLVIHRRNKGDQEGSFCILNIKKENSDVAVATIAGSIIFRYTAVQQNTKSRKQSIELSEFKNDSTLPILETYSAYISFLLNLFSSAEHNIAPTDSKNIAICKQDLKRSIARKLYAAFHQ